MKSTTIHIEGMHCKSCVNNIKSELNDLEGVEEIKINLAEGLAYISYDESEVFLSTIEKEINNMGFTTKRKKNKHKLQKKSPIKEAIMYGLVPHIGCIGFIIGSIFGVTILMNMFKPLLMNRYFFHILVLISLVFATLSSLLYLRKNELLSFNGARLKWKYLSTMYGTTVGINLLLFFLIFPMMANVGSVDSMGLAGSEFELSSMTIAVDIPCSGHAPLISNELKTISGVKGVEFSFPNKFEVLYDSTTSVNELLGLSVFNEYPATLVSGGDSLITKTSSSETTTSGCTGGSSCIGGNSCSGSSCTGKSEGCSGGCGGCTKK